MTSPPATPPRELPQSPSEYRFEVTPKLCEWAEKYRPGGFHPVNLGDTIDDGRFKLIRKLGNGSSSTVWLAVRQRYRPFEITRRRNLGEPLNSPIYVAVKILDARASTACKESAILEHLSSAAGKEPDYQHIIRLLEHFEIQGPNGSHRCLVFEVMSTTVASLAEKLPENHPMMGPKPHRYPVWTAKQILLHTLRGLALLHKNGIVHGGIQPTKLLFSTKGMRNVVPTQLGQDEAATALPLYRIDGKTDRWAPKKLYKGEPLYEFVELDEDLLVKICGFGTAFQATHPPADTATPISLRAPELLFHLPISTSIDIWSLGCLVYEFLAGEALFVVLHDDEVRGSQEEANFDLFCQLNHTLGKVPDYDRKAWRRNGRRSSAKCNHLPPTHRVYFREDRPDLYESLEAHFSRAKHPDLADAEAIGVIMLIRKMLTYDPFERPTAEELLKHPWFVEAAADGQWLKEQFL